MVPRDDEDPRLIELPAAGSVEESTVSSWEISGCLGEDYSDVLEHIRVTLADSGIDPAAYEGRSIDGNTVVCYHLPPVALVRVAMGYPPNQREALSRYCLDRRAKPIPEVSGFPSASIKPGGKIVMVNPSGVGPIRGKNASTVIVDECASFEDTPRSDEKEPERLGAVRQLCREDGRQRSILPFEKIEGPASEEPTISSLDIAEITGIDHGRVLVIIRKALEARGIDAVPFTYVQRLGSDRIAILRLPRRECEIVVGPNFSMAHEEAILRRWDELDPVCVLRPGDKVIVEKEAIGMTVGNPVGVTKVQFDNSPAPDGQTKTMSSLEIAEITGKRHDHVMRDIKTILDEAEIGAPKFGGTYLDVQNKERPCYYLPRFECDLVVSGYSVKYRKVIIRRWHELEAKEAATTAVKPLTLRESLQLNLDLLTQNEEKDRLLEAQKPDVEFVEKYVKTTGLHGIRKTAKSLGLRQSDFVRRCLERKVLFRDGNLDLQAYSQWIKAGYFDTKNATKADGRSVIRTLFTAKGIRWVSRYINRDDEQPPTTPALV